MNKWIPTNTGQFPEDGVKVLVTYLGYYDKKPHCNELAYRSLDKWYWADGCSAQQTEITAWKSIGEPYSPESEQVEPDDEVKSINQRIKSTPLTPVRKTMLCKECSGEMRYTGNARLSAPPYYEHRCDKCGYTEYFLNITYPTIVHEDKNEYDTDETVSCRLMGVINKEFSHLDEHHKERIRSIVCGRSCGGKCDDVFILPKKKKF